MNNNDSHYRHSAYARAAYEARTKLFVEEAGFNTTEDKLFGVSAGGMVNGAFILARQEGLEPPTPGLEGPCSIQLSYCRAVF